MSVEANKTTVRRIFAEAFNQGQLAVIDELLVDPSVDHQHPDVTQFTDHLKALVSALREAFPDLHFALTEMIGEGEWVALHSVMTGTHTGVLRAPIVPAGGPPSVLPTGRTIRVPHMHMIRFHPDRTSELWHIMDTFALVGQLGLLPASPRAAA